MRAALKRAHVSPDEVDEVVMGYEVVMGQVEQVGPNAFNARRCTLGAGLSTATTAMNVNRLCSSGLQAIWTGAQEFLTGNFAVVVAGADENMAMPPFLDYGARDGYALDNRTVIDGALSLVTDPFGNYAMGCTAKQVTDHYDMSREDQDAFAAESQRRALAAIEHGLFRDQIVPITVCHGKAEVAVDTDEHPRAGTTTERLARLKPAFRDGSTVAAGNSSGINDGAAAVVLMRENEARRRDPQLQLRSLGCTVAALKRRWTRRVWCRYSSAGRIVRHCARSAERRSAALKDCSCVATAATTRMVLRATSPGV